MKIETNFVPPIGGLAVRTATAIWVVALVLAGGVVALWVDAAMIQSQLPESTERLQQLEQRRASIAIPANMPSAADIAAMRSRVATANSLSVTGGRRLMPLLVLFEEMLPPDAWLVSASHKAREGEVVLVAEAGQAEELTKFLLNLEKSSRFS